jgi:hypothetical protein
MKNLSYLSSLLLLVLFLTACGKDGDNPSPGTATFRIDFAQSGDYQKFIKIFTITGGEFKYRGTGVMMPVVLSGNNLDDPTWSVEAQGVDKLEISTISGFSPVESGPATMTMKFTIYKNGVLLDEKSFTYNETTRERTEVLNYKAN